MLRSRDIVAVFFALILTQMAWNDNLESLSASVHLAFYLPRHDSAMGTLGTKPALLDVDGDGTTEALAVISNSKVDSDGDEVQWKLRILDLKPAMQNDKTRVAPFRPKVLFESDPIRSASRAKPVALVTGQVLVSSTLITADTHAQKEETGDRNRHYFCGVDWHDASVKCGTHCPGGLASDCPEGERCYADTPCDAHAPKHAQDQLAETMHLTPGGGLPSVFVLWSNGAVSMHSLTADLDGAEVGSKKKAPKLELRSMWQVPALFSRNSTLLETLNLQFFDSLSSGDQAKSGMVIVTALVTYQVPSFDDDSEDQDEETSYYVLALDAKTGATLWESMTQEELNELNQKDLPLPMARGSSSNARRRSMIPNLHSSSQQSSGSMVPNCMHAYRRSLMTSEAFPFAYFGDDDSTVQALHFDLQQHASKATKPGKKQLTASKKANPKTHSGSKTKSWASRLLPNRKHKHHQKTRATYGRPNVIVSHHERGIEVRSIKNGRSLCHLSLWENVLYADLDHDGVLDSVEVIAGNRGVEDEEDTDDSERWVQRLVKRVAAANQQASESANLSQRLQKTPLCHVLALSGVPIKEELFSASLCGTKRDHEDLHPSIEMIDAPPLAVESFQGKGKDIIVAVNTGAVHRFRGATGRRQWELVGKHHKDFPTWSDEANVALSRIGSENVVAQTRPILLAGENSLAIISARRGHVLASASFPQPSIRRPVLADVNGDGTTDVLVMTADAVWCYQVVVRTGASIFFRITTGLLLIGMMLALLRNRFGPHPGKRSTDA
jgi:hypothetical protein